MGLSLSLPLHVNANPTLSADAITLLCHSVTVKTKGFKYISPPANSNNAPQGTCYRVWSPLSHL